MKTLNKQDSRRILKSIEDLGITPRPQGCKKLKGRDGYRIRVGDFRVIYSVEDKRLLISVVQIGDRKDIYGS